MTTENGLIVGLMAFLFLFFGYLGVPVAFSLIAGVVVGTMFTPVSLPSIIGQLFNGVDSEALMAVPFFLLVGELMTSANVVIRIANLSQALVGHIRGGLAQVVTVFSMFFADMSGSTSADVAVLSRTMAKPMEQEGYGRPFIAALIASASTIACLVPPSITSVVYGAVGNVSIAGLFLAGFTPAILIGLGLMVYCFFFGPVGFRRQRASFGQLAGATKEASLTLMIPVILLGGILSGWFTPTEAGVIANVYILCIILPILNRPHLKRLPRDFMHAGLIYSLPLITVAAASAFGWMLAYLRGPMVVSGWIVDIAGNDPTMIMFCMVAVFTVVGDFIEPIPTVVIFMPIVNQLTEAGSINPIHMGVTLIVTLAFGLITPPYGLALLMASKFVGTTFSQALKAALPIYLIFFGTIAFVIFFPSTVLWLPKHVLPESVGCFKSPAGTGYICPE
jgi:tripartite ATP-independent transporter DctM subunit